MKETDNEYVNLAIHAVGLDYKKPRYINGKEVYRPYRNYYDAAPIDCEYWEVLYSAGYAMRGHEDRYGGRMYSLTCQGFEWLGKQLEIEIRY